MNWHRMLGLLLTDFFAGSPYVVELEKDLSLHSRLGAGRRGAYTHFRATAAASADAK
jgi:hypothetical protein